MTGAEERLADLSSVKSEDKAMLERIARALETLAGTLVPTSPDWSVPAYIWDGHRKALLPASQFSTLPLHLLLGIEQQADILEKNTRQFALGYSANNVLIWGARGTGKSSLVKAVFEKIRQSSSLPLHLIELQKEDSPDLGMLSVLLAKTPNRRFILFMDDVSFEASDDRYKSLKSALEGGVAGQAQNVLIYATSNRRHLLPRSFSENDHTHLHPAETAEENISLSDRFGLWIGFYPYDQDTYLRMVASYAAAYNIPVHPDDLRRQALEWSVTRGARSGRVAWQFIRHLAGTHNIYLD